MKKRIYPLRLPLTFFKNLLKENQEEKALSKSNKERMNVKEYKKRKEEEVMKERKIKHVVVPIPASLEEAAEFIGRIGKEQREIDRIQNELNKAVEKLKSESMSETQGHEVNISKLFEGLFVFGQSHRDELTEDGKKKTVEVPTGIFGWRMTPPAVSLKNVKQILKELVKRRLKQFIRVKREVDKEAMLKEPELAASVKGVSIGQHEEFMVKPAELEVEITSDVSKLKKVAS